MNRISTGMAASLVLAALAALLIWPLTAWLMGPERPLQPNASDGEVAAAS